MLFIFKYVVLFLKIKIINIILLNKSKDIIIINLFFILFISYIYKLY